jgi:TatA/E family protein of Tat protein translocase
MSLPDVIIIAVVIAILLFGAKYIPEMMRKMGENMADWPGGGPKAA